MTQPRITIKHLEAVAARINVLTGSPLTYYGTNPDGTHTAQIGNYRISRAYGGYCLHRSSLGGGVSKPLGGGHIPARALMEQMNAFIAGIYTSKD